MPAESDVLSMWIVMVQPADMPSLAFVARRWEIHAGGMVATSDLVSGTSLESVRGQLPSWLYRIPRHATDEPHIVECWV